MKIDLCSETLWAQKIPFQTQYDSIYETKGEYNAPKYLADFFSCCLAQNTKLSGGTKRWAWCDIKAPTLRTFARDKRKDKKTKQKGKRKNNKVKGRWLKRESSSVYSPFFASGFVVLCGTLFPRVHLSLYSSILNDCVNFCFFFFIYWFQYF